MGKWSLIIVVQLFFAVSLYCQTEEWTLTKWEMAGQTWRSPDYDPNKYCKVYLRYSDSTFIWRDFCWGRMTRHSGTFFKEKNGVYRFTDGFGAKIEAETDSEHNVTCVVSAQARTITYWGKVDD